MKPRSKIQQQFVEWAGQLPPLDEKRKEWARGLFPAEALYYSRRGNHSEFHCMCCGAVVPTFGKWPVDEHDIPRWTCPECGAECEVLPQNGLKGESWYKSSTNSIYVTLADVFNGIQVFRTFEVCRYNYRTAREDGTPCGAPTEFHYSEIWQNWIRPDGKETITHRPYARSFNYFRWDHHKEYVIGSHNAHCSGYYSYGDVFDVTGNYFFPGQRFTPLLKRNGMRRKYLSMSECDPVAMCRQLLNDNLYEEIVKQGQTPLAVYLTTHSLDKRFIHAVRICTRNGYRIKDPGLWLDYLDDLVFLGLDTHSPHYVCPKSLKKVHAQTTRRRERVVELQREEARRKEAAKWEDRYAVAKAPFLGIVFGDGRITISVIPSVEDVRLEGKAMHHCVFSNGYYKKPDRVLLTARDEKGKRLETVEIGLDPYVVLQSRGLQNGTTKAHKDIVAICEANMDVFRRAVPKMTVPLHLTGKNANYYAD